MSLPALTPQEKQTRTGRDPHGIIAKGLEHNHNRLMGYMLQPHKMRYAPVRPSTDTTYWYGQFDAIGVEAVLEHIASGKLTVEIAVENLFPLILFKRWIDLRIDPALMQEALSVKAEWMLVKADMVLAEKCPSNPAEATVMKTVAERLTWMAERLDSKRWGPPGKSAERPPAVVIEMNLGNLTEGGSMTITVDPSQSPTDEVPYTPFTPLDFTDLSEDSPEVTRQSDFENTLQLPPQPRQRMKLDD